MNKSLGLRISAPLRRAALLASACTMTFIYGWTARATLGESASSIAQDHAKFSNSQNSISTVSHTGYSVQEMLVDGTNVREYVSSSGIVFGIAWNGVSHPDLSKLLGNYSADYEDANRNHQRVQGRRHLSLKSSNPDRLVVEKWGHMRDLQGRAYSPTLVPTGVALDDIK